MSPHRLLRLAALFTGVICAAEISRAQPTGIKLTCATCHRKQAESQPHTPMGMALQLPPNQTLLKTHGKLTFEKGGFAYSIESNGDRSTYRVTDGKQTLTLPVSYSFGVGMQTYMLERNGHLYESLVSYYPTIGGLAVTMGDETLSPHTILEAVGRELGSDEITACFSCHSTGPPLKGLPASRSFAPGLTCERCHVGAQAHLEALSRGQTGIIPKKLGAMPAEDTSNFCGTCHRTFDTVVRMRLFGQLNVRFQPYRLAKSSCFNGADPRIGCTACHDPHRDLVTRDADYDSKCLACHTGRNAARNASFVPSAAPAASAAATTKTCPVGNQNCVSCHMPKTELPGSHTRFTDHMIRVVKPNQPYPE